MYECVFVGDMCGWKSLEVLIITCISAVKLKALKLLVSFARNSKKKQLDAAVAKYK